MSRNTWQYAWAALLAALVWACDGPSEPPKPPPRPEAPQVSVLLVDGRTPASGMTVNWTKPPETPVTLIGRATHRGRKLPADSTEWTANGVFLGRGDTIAVSVLVGEVLAVYTARADGFTTADSVRFVNPADSLVVHISTPEDGRQYRWDEPVRCAVLVTIIPPRPYEKSTSQRLNGEPVSCNGDREFVQGAPPAPIVFTAGEYTFEACAELVDRNVEICATSTFTVKERPWQIVFTNVASAESRDFWVMDEDGTNLRRLTNTGGLKTWPTFSLSGDTLAYTAKGACGDWVVHLARPDGSASRELYGPDANGYCLAETARAPYFSPDGQWLSFIGAWADVTDLTVSAFEIGVDGSNLRLLRNPASFYAAVYHPNGQEVIIAIQEWIPSGAGRRLRDGVIALNRYTGTDRRLFTDVAPAADDAALRPFVHDVSPDGQWVSVSTFWTLRVLIIRTDGSGEYRFLTPEGVQVRWNWFCFGGDWVCYVPKNKLNSYRRVDLNGQNDQEVATLAGIREIETPIRHPLFPK